MADPCLALTIALYVASAFTLAHAADRFKRLNASDIRSAVIGKVVTDGSHWADRFESNGRLDGMELGQHKQGTWKFQGNEICVTRKARKPVEECFEIWLSGSEVEYRRDGITLTSGELRAD